MINERIDEFTFLSKIGEGGMATVYKAFDNNFADHVAVKVLKKEYVFNKNVRARFISEARKLHKLSHPNIIGVRRIIDAGDICAFAMDMVNGQTLKEYVSRNKSLKNTEIKDFTNKMLNALDFVHSKGFVHRDIKPSNFMITEDQNVLLLDFGIAKDTNSESDYTATGTTHQMGTPSYMSPEQIKSTKAVDHRSDIYSLGVVIYYMVNGSGPYEGQVLSLFELYEKIVNSELELSNSKFDKIIKSATQKDLEKRIQNCEMFRMYLDPSYDTGEIPKLNLDDNIKESTSTEQTDEKDLWYYLSITKFFLIGVVIIIKFGDHEKFGFIASSIGTSMFIYGLYLVLVPKNTD